MRIPKSIFLYFFLVLFTNRCLLLLPNGNNQQDLSPFAFLLGLLGGSPSSTQNLTPGATVDLSGDGKPDGTLVDSDGDGVSDGINLTGGTTPNLILIDTNGDGTPDAVDSNGDGLPDYYISPYPPGFLTTGPGGSGNPVVIIVDGNGNVLGFDTDGDGTPNDTAIVTILGDTTPPIITSSLLTGTFSTSQTTTLTCSDNKAPGSIVYTLDASTPSFSPKQGTVIASSSKAVSLSTEGTHTLQAICRDLAGNLSTPISIVYTIDTKIPALTLVSQSTTAISASAGAINNSTATWKSDRSGTFTIREGSSCDSGTIATTGSVTAGVDQGFVLSHTHFTGEGTKTYRICVTASNGLTGFVSVSLQRDDTAPVVTADPGAGNYGTATSVSLSCSDTGGAGCDQIAYAVQAGSVPTNPAIQGTTGTISSGTLYASAIAMTDGAVTYTKFVARDKAGNVSGVSSQNYTVDTQVATITVNSHTAAINGSSNVSLSWQSSKAGSYQIRIGGSSCANGTALTNTGSNANVVGNAIATTDITTTIANSHFAEEGNTIRICVANLVGNFGSTTRATNKDTTAPVVTMASPSGSGPFASGTQLQLSCSDTGGSGCDKIIYSSNGTEPTFDGSGSVTNGTVYTSPVALANGSNQVKYLARDLAGNLSSAGNQSFHVGPPNAPAFVEAQAGGTSAVVQWWPVSGATSYTVYYSTSPGVTTASTSFGPVTDPYATIAGLTGGTLYYFRVLANSPAGASAISLLEAGALTTATPPGTSETGMHVDISAGQGTGSGLDSSIVIDPVNGKLLVVTRNGANSNKPSLFRCNLDGTVCTHTDISAGQGTSSGQNPGVVLDSVNGKLLVVTWNYGNGSKLSLFRCNLDGTSCTHTDLSAVTGQGYSSGQYPSVALDFANKKLLVVTRNGTNIQKPSLFRCNLDGTACTHTDLSVGQGYGSGYFSSVVVDPFNGKLLVVTMNGANSNKPSLFRCNLDGTVCTHTDISAGQGTDSGSNPRVVLDTVNGKLLVVTWNYGNGSKLSLFRCNLDGTSCAHTDLSAVTGQGNGSGQNPSVALDIANGKLLVVTMNGANSNKPSLFRCNLDGTACSHTDISSGQGQNSGYLPSTVLNPANGKLLVVTQNVANSGKPSLFIW
ncbi:chitobiase/beta-hexosaminidase C-terminal domain-containing protein [Leptospira sp. 2 VSF19]|uniref:Chitobiase/beta-hexosaminidase C-terminal domain-containing protein n=1 Tax=Leptospira soteropolitanensis TaxID=2950025 RepID=A0AAW5V7G5_9LEPT|nr:chitobiase/beta-hexosaminidase C-terminal domain-containing protein [Leptospira soteropolitanensis]MCW7491242.1 chitobiase/beta-hexosaminidase C-terminal domain-containing protein [Leptospira soteropolitanensis]MCW7498827.1 chitobiase/beta-hexosaminidase C-terminal domain-containing protein [Leptospira soteropolitanensis]MCW7521581.1 chitobiase/beta-hexosaminidase C-terminal domain-containing protein [Leptospira soteropolitanensis]MCW7524930.1 chitobiase/beta-hexosaminidase C-terminal domain